MTTYTVANITDALFNLDWTFDGSNNLNGAAGVGLTVGAPTGGDVANSINVSGGYYVDNVNLSATYLTQASAASTYAPKSSPTFIGTVTAPTFNATSGFTVNGSPLFSTRATASHSPLLTTAFSTSSSTFVMSGVGSTCTVTPAFSGTVIILSAFNLHPSSGMQITMCYGTGTAPAQGVAITGTAIFSATNVLSFTGTVINPTSLCAMVTGLTLSTAYWFDFAVQSTSGSGSISNASFFAAEI